MPPEHSTPLRLVLLGDPVSHSRSPAMHQAALDALGIPGEYTARRVDAEGMTRAAREMREGRLDGANITMPHKHLAYRLADRVNEEAERAGSVNTWRRENGQLVGVSTDVPGIRRAWARRRLPDTGPVLVLGSGGAAAAALVALSDREVVVAGRSIDRAVALVDRCQVGAKVVGWGTPVGEAVVVNCTPLGMHGEALPSAVMEQATAVFDMAYGQEETPAVVDARRQGRPVADGIDLLVAQAEEAFRLWTGREAPPGLMEHVARNNSSGP